MVYKINTPHGSARPPEVAGGNVRGDGGAECSREPSWTELERPLCRRRVLVSLHLSSVGNANTRAGVHRHTTANRHTQTCKRRPSNAWKV